ncbi:hypothetical protein L3X38_023557 [Prunus dulcis]|uniref:Uncharacterized protein n=1 Tax=Prunus dulcis TaxID=3755 RepID=A0AAD4Z5F5_PRUDU|nr:hypothetical protein L3X38_023557 [Prunus dulcis]
MNRADPASKRLTTRQPRLLPCRRKTHFRGAGHLPKLPSAKSNIHDTCRHHNGLHKVPHWNFVQSSHFHFPINREQNPDPPAPGDTLETVAAPASDAWNESDFLCRNYILNGLSDVLYNVYSPIKTAKALWESLDKKYRTEDAGMKKFIVEKMELSESIQVADVIEKLPPSWKDFKNYLNHKRKEMGLEDLIVRLRIKEDNHCLDKNSRSIIKATANIVEKESRNNKKRKHSGEGSSQREFQEVQGV